MRPGSSPGLFVTVAGPDGAGKSTLCDALARRFSTARPVLRLHGRPHVLPQRRIGVVTDPHGAAPYGRLASLAKITYLFFDFTLGWLFRVRPFVQRGGLVILERGWWDMLVDPRRYRLRLPSELIRLLGKLQARGGVLLVLEAPAELLVARKPELTADETARQLKAWRSIDAHGTAVVFLDASRDLAGLIAQAVREVEERIPVMK